MKKKTSEKIVEYIRNKKQISANELADHFEISRQALYKHLSKLLEDNIVSKIGTPPKVFYSLNTEVKKVSNLIKVEEQIKKYIDEHYLFITPSGKKEDGWEGFVYWCKRTNQPISKTANEYYQTSKKYDLLKRNNLLNGSSKLQTTFQFVYLDYLYYLDFYSIERFGKTKIGQMLLYAKQSQNKTLIRELSQLIKKRIEFVIQKHKVDAVGFIPPTVKREVQFMRELEKNIALNTPSISIVKIKTDVAVPQKTLSKLQDRIENAHTTLVVDEKRKYKNILLIDDAVGSGSTLNETAKQLKSKKLVGNNVIGLAITGSFKGFDVISEV